MANARLWTMFLAAILVVGCVNNPDAAQFTNEGTPFDVGEPAPDAGPVDVGAEDLGEAEEDVEVVDAAPELLPTSAPCEENDECEGGYCLTGPDWPDGYCTNATCHDSGCAEGNECVPQPSGGTYCTPRCSSDDECRLGYACDYVDPGGFREPPSGPRVCMPPRGLPDGEPCDDWDDCSGFCLRDWPGGYCSTFRCETSDDCARQGNENVCLTSGGRFSQCVRACASVADCREGYVCDELGDGSGICVPDPAIPFDPTVFDPGPLNITCGFVPGADGAVSFDYEIAADTTSYMITPMVKDGNSLDPGRITTPSGTEIPFSLGNERQAYGAEIYSSMNPTFMPPTPARVGELESGTHTFSLETEGDEICYYLLEEDAPGTTLDVNVYLVAVPGITADNAATHPDMQAVMTQFDTVYDQVGIDIDDVRYFDVSEEAATRFEVIRSRSDVTELVRLSESPGDDLDSALSVNIFFVHAMAIGGAIGISLGLPGPAGLHGTHGSGIVFTGEFLGIDVRDGFGERADGNLYTGLIVAHEVGHYLGLWHTSEQGGQLFDPLDDTPECAQITDTCPDVENLMFPFAGHSHTGLTDQQGWVLGASQLTKAADDGGN